MNLFCTALNVGYILRGNKTFAANIIYFIWLDNWLYLEQTWSLFYNKSVRSLIRYKKIKISSKFYLKKTYLDHSMRLWPWDFSDLEFLEQMLDNMRRRILPKLGYPLQEIWKMN